MQLIAPDAGIGYIAVDFDFAQWEAELQSGNTAVDSIAGMQEFARAGDALAPGPYNDLLSATGALQTADVQSVSVLSASIFDRLTQPRPVPMRALGADIRSLRTNLKAERAKAAKSANPQTSTYSPNAALRADLQTLDAIVAELEAWRVGHHSNVHLPIGESWVKLGPTLESLAAVVSNLADADADGLHLIRRTVLPNLRAQLERLVHDLRDDLHAFRMHVTTEIVPRIDKEVESTNERITRINTVTVPHLEKEIRTEAQDRAEGDTTLKRGIATEASTRSATDLSTLAQLAPLVAWANTFGKHTTTKVNTLERPLDQMLGNGTNWLNALILPAGLEALVVAILVKTAGTIPEVLGALERAAGQLVGIV